MAGNVENEIRVIRPRPKVTISLPPNNNFPQQEQRQEQSPYDLMSAALTSVPSGQAPDLQNPFFQHLYSQRAGDFVCKQFDGLNRFTKSGLSVGERSAVWVYAKFRKWSRNWFTHIFLFTILLLYTFAGALMFIALEGPPETQFLENVKEGRNKLANRARMLSSDTEKLQDPESWEGAFRNALTEYEKLLYDAYSKGQFDNAELKKTWTIVNSMFYCGTIYTTIGYGHISPRTYSGRIVTIVYAIFGIPIFLILLADFGKLFTRVIKFLWVFVRRLYYTGSCRKVRKTTQAQDVMRGLNAMYDFVRKPSMAFDPNSFRGVQQPQQTDLNTPHSLSMQPTESPMTPLPENLQNYEIDDEFNLPISVAFSMLLTYMLFGAAMYSFFEKDWTFFESFYFVFISISTIGFGDFVPAEPLFMMASIIYLIFGLALTSMLINVIQVKLSDHFRQASSKIIGLQMAEAASQSSQPQSPSELQSVQSGNSNNDNNEITHPAPLPVTSTAIITDKNTKNTNSKML